MTRDGDGRADAALSDIIDLTKRLSADSPNKSRDRSPWHCDCCLTILYWIECPCGSGWRSPRRPNGIERCAQCVQLSPVPLIEEHW